MYLLLRQKFIQIICIIVATISFNAFANQTPNLQKTWQFQTQGSIWSSIVLDNSQAFFGSDDGHFYSVNLDAKNQAWKFKTQGKVRSTAALDEQQVYFSSDDGYLYALNKASGKLVWKAPLNDADVERIEPAKSPPYRYDYRKSSPIIVNDTLFIGSADTHMYAISKQTGQLKWKFKTNGIIRATPVYHQGTLFFGSLDNYLYAINAQTGQEVWKFLAYNVIVSSAAIIDDTVIVGSRDTYIYALDPNNGDLKWDYRFVDNSWVDSTASQSNEQGVFYIGSSDSKKILKIDVKTGKEIWSAPTLGWTWPTPFIYDNVVYIGSTGAKGYWNDVRPGFIGVDATTGKPKTHYLPQTISGYVTGGVFGSPAVYDNKLYVPDLDGNVYEFKL